jgi:hypothetical protein
LVACLQANGFSSCILCAAWCIDIKRGSQPLDDTALFIHPIGRSGRSVKGDTINLTLSIHNDMPYPFTMMRVYMDAISEGEHTSYAFHLAPRESITFSPQLHCAYRGCFKVGMTYVDIQMFLALPVCILICASFPTTGSARCWCSHGCTTCTVCPPIP